MYTLIPRIGRSCSLRLSLLFTIPLLTLSLTLNAAPAPIASVHGVEINFEQFNECFKLRRAHHKQKKLSKSRLDQISFFAMKPFVEVLLVKEELKKRGLKVDEARVDAKVELFRKKSPNQEGFIASLNRKMQTLDSFRAEQWVKEASYLILDADQKLEPEPGEIEERLKKQKERSKMPEQVRGRQLTLPLPNKPNAEHINKAFKYIQEIHKLILKEEKDFGLYIQRFSEGPLRGRMGDIGYVKKGDLLPNIEKALWALKDGEISVPFRSSVGWHLVQRLDTIKAHERAYLQDVSKIKERVKLLKFNSKMHLYIKELWRSGAVHTNITRPTHYQAGGVKTPK